MSRARRLLLVGSLVLLTVLGQPGGRSALAGPTGPVSGGGPASGGEAGGGAGKVHPDLWQRLDSAPGGTTTFLVRMAEQSDTAAARARGLQQAAGLAGRARVESLRREVVRSLEETAARTQTPVLAMLENLKAQGHVAAVDPLWIVNAVAVTGDRVAVQRLSARAEVSNLDPPRVVRGVLAGDSASDAAGGETVGTAGVTAGDSTVTDSTVTDGPAAGMPWNLSLVNAPQAWAAGADGTGVVVASLDTGVDWNHPALRSRFRGYNPDDPQNPQVVGNWKDFVLGISTPYDDCGHGTHTTGTMVGFDPSTGTRTGVAPGARWIAAKVLDRLGYGNDYVIVKAAQWLLAPTDSAGVGHPEWAPDVINNSFGGKPDGTNYLRDVVKAWREAGIFPVFAAGNSGPAAGTVEEPGIYPESYAVAAVDQTRALAYFSSRGPSPNKGDQKPNISAPGKIVRSTWPGGAYTSDSGTSMAAPHVAGSAALVLSARPGLTPAEVQQALTSTAAPLTDSSYPASPNAGYGVGLVNAGAAVCWTGCGAVSGTVTDTGSGLPVAASIALQPRGGPLAAGADGSFSGTLLAGTYSATVSAPGYPPETRTVTVSAGGSVTLDVGLTAVPPAPLHGSVTDSLTGLPLAGVTVTAVPDGGITPVASAVTGSDGSVDLGLQFEDGYTLTATRENYLTLPASFTLTGESSGFGPLALDPGDVNGDGAIDLDDLAAVTAAWGGSAGPDPLEDGTVDLRDLAAVGRNYGKHR